MELQTESGRNQGEVKEPVDLPEPEVEDPPAPEQGQLTQLSTRAKEVRFGTLSLSFTYVFL